MIRRIIHQGNIVRYTVDVHDNVLDVDILYENDKSFARKSEVYLKIDKKDIIHYEK